jgi:hypothetical protein
MLTLVFFKILMYISNACVNINLNTSSDHFSLGSHLILVYVIELTGPKTISHEELSFVTLSDTSAIDSSQDSWHE